MEGLQENDDSSVESLTKDKKIIYNFSKRILDLLLSLLGLVILSPLLVIVAIAIKIESKGPIIFSQKRIGLNGQEFKIYKFRSMVVNAEELKEKLSKKNEMSGPMFKIKD
ncbi:MAG: sugar transferase, partial [Clostridium sp.]